MMDQIEGAFPNERVALKLLWKCIAAIDRNTGSASKIAGGAATAFDRPGQHSRDTPPRANYPPRFLLTDAIDFGGGAIHGDTGQRWRHVIKRIPRRIPLVVHEQADVITVIARKAAPVIIEAEP